MAAPTHLSPDWEVGYNRLLIRAEGVLYEDPQIQVGLRSEYRAHMGCVILYYTNKSSAPIGSFTTTINNNSLGQLNINCTNIPDATVQPESQTQQTIMLEAHQVFSEAPTIRISYLAGALQALTLKLPVVPTKFMEPANLSADDFFKRWKQIGGAPREAQKVFGIRIRGHRIEPSRTRRVIEGFKWGVLDNVDPNSKNFVCASVLHTLESGKFGCLLRVEPNIETGMYRVTIRATDETVPPVLLKIMEGRLALGSPPPSDSQR